jgi:hypothetical protein
MRKYLKSIAGAGLFLGLIAGLAYAATQTLTLGANTGPGGILTLFGSSSGSATIQPLAAAGTGTVVQIPAIGGTDTMATIGTAQTFSAAQTFGEVHGTTYAPTLTANNYAAAATDCGKTLLFPTGTTPTLTLPNLNSSCTIVVIQNSAVQFTPQAASGGTLATNVNAFTKSKAQNAVLYFTISVPSASAATWIWSGDGA